jgi:predicted lipoprotein with Yx(FWY)xxD motif
MKAGRVLLFVPLLLLAAACGSSSKSSSSSSSAASKPAKSTAEAKAPPVVIATKHTKLGTVLAAGPKRMTVYLFEADNGPRSHCTGACATAWPPVVGKPSASGAAQEPSLGTITRPDGNTQVTYKGHPLYFFIKDKDNGDAYGEAVKQFGAEWYVLNPAGNKVDNS